MGPAVQGPSLPPAYPTDADDFSNLLSEDLADTIHSLTLPPVPNYDIPESPPGSPPPSTAKISHFLSIKKRSVKKGGPVHFNVKLASSTALTNPAFLDKLMDMAGISTEDAYALAEPDDLALPREWPQWAYAEELNKSQKKLAPKKEKEREGKREFVSAGVER
jgi:HCNGP-like protein